MLRPVAGQAPPAAGAGFLYSGVVSAADLGKGHWAVSVFVQDLATGTTESANVTAGAAGGAVLVPDCTFDVV